MLDLDAFGAMLRAARLRRGWRPIDLALEMGWSGTAPVYRYERGGPEAPRPDPDTVNLFAQVLDLDYADRVTMLGFAGHLPDTPQPTAEEEARVVALARPGLDWTPQPALLFGDRWRVLALNRPYRALFGLPETTEAVWRATGVTLLDLVWNPDVLRPAGATPPARLEPSPTAAEVQVRRFQLAHRLRRHEGWYRAFPASRATWPGFLDVWERVEAELVAPLAALDLGAAARREAAALRTPTGQRLRFEASHREVHGGYGVVGLLAMMPLDDATEAAVAGLVAAAGDDAGPPRSPLPSAGDVPPPT